ncbi:MAG: M48 family metalloprotease [Pseudomonadales bacterium]|nr:M48 family metalloprotease [Pseudomonadales bacterium]
MLTAVLHASSLLAMSEEKEIEMGREEHKKIIAQYGVYRDENLQTYVSMVGERIAKESSRPNLEYHFTVLDDDMINAFALPGGFIYVTRGMLTHMNSESELAAVLGHEVAHVTEKHAIRRNSRGQALNILSTVAAAVTMSQMGQVAAEGVSELGGMFGGVLVTGYSRDFELEADEVGAKFMAQAGYSPEAMLRTIEILKAKDRIEIEQARLEKREPLVYHGFLSTHPDHDTRYKQAIEASMDLVEEYDEFIKTDEFLEKLNGLTYGKSNQVGVVRKNTFYHPKLGIKLRFPDDWRLMPTRQGVQMFSQVSDASFFITTGQLYKDATPENYAKEHMNLKVREGRAITIGGMPAFLGIANRAESVYGPRPVRFAIIFDLQRRLAFELYGSGKHDLRKIVNDRDFIATIFSFGKMNKADFSKAKKPTLQVVRAEEGTRMEDLADESPITNYALDKLRVMNGLYPRGEPEPGQLIKIVD